MCSWLRRFGGGGGAGGRDREVAKPRDQFISATSSLGPADQATGRRSLRENELVTVSHAQAVITAAVLDQNFPRLAEELFGTQ